MSEAAMPETAISETAISETAISETESVFGRHFVIVPKWVSAA
jgi:hypothetical protein